MTGLGRTIRMLAKARKLPPRGAPRILREVTGFGANPGGLTMLTHTPQALGPRAALVVVLHGCTQSAEGYAEGAGWIAAAERHGFALLCPEQTSNNNPNLCFNWFSPIDTRRGNGEAGSIAQMILHMIALHDLDPARVFITGLSAGGAMANVLLATYPELFAGGAIIAGLSYGSANTVPEAFAAMAHQRHDSDLVLGDRVRAASRHSGPWPRIAVWHGDSDATVSPGAGDAVTRQWLNVHGVAGAPFQSRSGRQQWRSAAGDVVVEHHSIPGMGHGAPLSTAGPDAVGAAGPYLLEAGISSTLEILKSWGLARDRAPQPQLMEAHRVLASDAIAAPSASVPLAGSVQRPIDVGEVITKALRAAGLMK